MNINRYIVSLIICLIIINQPGLLVSAVDNTAPVVHKVMVSKTNVTQNEIITVSINVTDDGIIEVVAALFYHDGDYLFNQRLYLNETSGLFETYLNVTTYLSPLYIGDVLVIDYQKNRATYSDGPSYTSPRIYIEGIPDMEYPTFHSMEISKTTIAVGESVNITINATDDTAISQVEIHLFIINTDSIMSTLYAYPVGGVFIGTYTATLYSDSFYVGRIIIGDPTSKNTIISDGRFNSSVVLVTGTVKDTEDPVLHDIYFDRLNGSLTFFNVAIYANVTDDVGIKMIQVYLFNIDGVLKYSTSLIYDNYTGLFKGHTDLKWTSPESLQIKVVRITDMFDNDLILYADEGDFIAPVLLIDVTNPVAFLSYLNGTVFTGNVILRINVSEVGKIKASLNDTNLGIWTLQTDTYLDINLDSTLVDDGYYIIDIEISDLFGNKIDLILNCYINNTGSVILGTTVYGDGYVLYIPPQSTEPIETTDPSTEATEITEYTTIYSGESNETPLPFIWLISLVIIPIIRRQEL